MESSIRPFPSTRAPSDWPQNAGLYGRYSSKLPLSAASPKGGLLCLKFEKVLPGKAYTLFMVSGDIEIPFFNEVPFADIAEHTPGDEKLPEDPPGSDDSETTEGL